MGAKMRPRGEGVKSKWPSPLTKEAPPNRLAEEAQCRSQSSRAAKWQMPNPNCEELEGKGMALVIGFLLIAGLGTVHHFAARFRLALGRGEAAP